MPLKLSVLLLAGHVFATFYYKYLYNWYIVGLCPNYKIIDKDDNSVVEYPTYIYEL